MTDHNDLDKAREALKRAEDVTRPTFVFRKDEAALHIEVAKAYIALAEAQTLQDHHENTPSEAPPAPPALAEDRKREITPSMFLGVS